MDKRRMCPHCRAFITSSDRVCPYCGEPVGQRAVDRRNAGEMLVGFIPNARFVTVTIVMVNLALFAGELLSSGNALVGAGAESGMLVFGYRQWYRLITAGYLHYNLLHIGMNMWALFDLGAQVEEIYGPARLFIFFTLTSIAGFLLSAYLSPLNPSVGASAGLFGLIGAMIAFGVRNQNSMGRAIRGVYVRWAIYGLLFGLLPGVNNTAHLGGLAAGFAIAFIAGTSGAVRSTAEQGWRAGAAACLLLTAYSFYQLYRHIPL